MVKGLATDLNKVARAIAGIMLVLAVAICINGFEPGPAWAQQGVDSAEVPLGNPTGGTVPGEVMGSSSDSDFWRAVRGGSAGNISIPDQNAATLVQSEGEAWRSFRNGPLTLYASWALLGMIVLLGIFYAIRGRIKIAHGRSGQTITRFAAVERFGHWMLASSFVVLALTGLNILYGRYTLKHVIGNEAFAFVTQVGKYMHNYLAFAFMAGLVMIFVMWVRHNLPDKTDIKWILQGGGIFSSKLHPPAKKFNAGQKVIFWLTILGGISLSLSGWQLLFPYTTHFFGETFAKVNLVFGTDLPVALSVLQEQQLATLWHSIMSVFMICVIIAHIYIGSVGMEGAFDAMGSGEVDLNWAKEHHSLWVEEHMQDVHDRAPDKNAPQPAE
ncbi:formate dehydrogenase gamma subunit [Roseibium hamelinense]|uniref:Formate dehydrogenase gamma subunit n=1 Tax=Roseibium hamelinense TaxID=150831 RepID=A0A562T7F4_9HYPH|nr:formate dehydrogenase subunit gamma [Roseibium hamelinense]MTI42362.1 formate dehydrogenase subunit gamma [Roseibium hamelinense]TWI89549.1 formate dehydrogenase gamma subunit [Roseibium hamelinense]